jgi:hypothetical protein
MAKVKGELVEHTEGDEKLNWRFFEPFNAWNDI